MNKQMSKQMSLDVPPASPLRGTSPLRGRKASFKGTKLNVFQKLVEYR